MLLIALGNGATPKAATASEARFTGPSAEAEAIAEWRNCRRRNEVKPERPYKNENEI